VDLEHSAIGRLRRMKGRQGPKAGDREKEIQAHERGGIASLDGNARPTIAKALRDERRQTQGRQHSAQVDPSKKEIGRRSGARNYSKVLGGKLFAGGKGQRPR